MNPEPHLNPTYVRWAYICHHLAGLYLVIMTIAVVTGHHTLNGLDILLIAINAGALMDTHKVIKAARAARKEKP